MPHSLSASSRSDEDVEDDDELSNVLNGCASASTGLKRFAKAAHRVRTEDVYSDAESFAELGVSPLVLRGLSAAGYLRPSPVQRAVIPRGREGRDLIVHAKSGTGKTVVFAVIALEAVQPAKSRVQALVLAPTRELAVQTAEVIVAVGRYLEGVGCVALIGGLPAGEQERRLRQGPGQVVVGTPGRTRALLESGSLGFSLVRLVVLDEADRLLTAPSLEGDTRAILGCLPERIQLVAVSATFEPGVLHDLEGLMGAPERLDLVGGGGVSLKGVRQYYALVQGAGEGGDGPVENPDDLFALKSDQLVRLLSQLRGLSQAVVFCNDQHNAQWLAGRLTAAGFPSAFLSGALDQRDRLQIMADVRRLRVRAVVSTDLVARGVDLDLVNLVVNMDVPPEPATYMHRVGRTGRFGTLGLAVSLLTEDELVQLKSHLQEVRGGEVMPLPAEIPEDLYAVDIEDEREREAMRRLSLAPVTEAPMRPSRPQRPRYKAKGEEEGDRHEGEGKGEGDEGGGANADDDRPSTSYDHLDPLTAQRRAYYGPQQVPPQQPWLPPPGPHPPYPYLPHHRFPTYRPQPVPYYQGIAYGQHPYYAPYGPYPSQRVWPGVGPASAPLGPENEPPQRPPKGEAEAARMPLPGAYPPPWAIPPHPTGQYGTNTMRQALPGPSYPHSYGHSAYRAPYRPIVAPGSHLLPSATTHRYYQGPRPHVLSRCPPFNGVPASTMAQNQTMQRNRDERPGPPSDFVDGVAPIDGV